MLDIGFTELLLIAGVALVVVGPQRLPVLTRTIGTLLGRAQRYVSDVKNDIQRQMEVEELKKVQETVRDISQTIESGVGEVQKEVDGLSGGFSSAFEEDKAFASVYDRKSGLYLGAPEKSWTQEQDDIRLRDRIRTRMRKRYLTKRARYD